MQGIGVIRSHFQDLPTASFGLRQTPGLMVHHRGVDCGGDGLATRRLNALGLDTALLVLLAAATRARIVAANFFHCHFSLKSQVNRPRSRMDPSSRRPQARHNSKGSRAPSLRTNEKGRVETRGAPCRPPVDSPRAFEGG